jgi:superfamily I DNA/RNA helicase
MSSAISAVQYLPENRPVRVPLMPEETVAGVELNSDQVEAVTSRHTPLAVIAGPGTGKTRCLSARAAWLVQDQGVPAENVLAVTFTNRAAAGMRQRIAELLGGLPPERSVRAMTLHRFCLDFLTRVLGKPVSVADETDRAVLLARALGGIETRARLQEISEAISRARARGETPEDYTGSEDMRRCWTAYRRHCRALGVYDYDDLIAETAALLKRDNELRAQTRGGIAHLLVDEFQDLNPAQFELLCLLLDGDGTGLFVIGDPNQSIYAFRGADSRIFDHLRTTFRGLSVQRLESGYRVPPGIADAANSIAAPEGFGESAPPLPVAGKWTPVRMVRAVSETAEAIAVAREICQLAGGTGMLEAHGQGRAGGVEVSDETFSFGEIAVIARTGALLGSVEEALVVEGIPVRFRGTGGFLEHELVRGVAAWVRLLVNPGDTLRCLEAMRLAGLEIDNEYFTAVRAEAAGEGKPLLDVLKRRISREVPLSESSRPAAEFLTCHETFRRKLSGPPDELLEAIIERFVAPEQRDIRELEHLRSAVACLPSAAAFAARVSLARQADLERGSGPRAAAEAVTLMTMHAAKGLEFPVVFVVAAEDELAPFTLLESNPGEERRLLYVAMTRASRRLYLTSSIHRVLWGRVLSGEWSPLLANVPPEARIEYQPKPPRGNRDKQLSLL